MEKRWTVEELATLYGRSAHTIRRWIASRELASIKVGSVVFVNDSDRIAFENNHRREKPTRKHRTPYRHVSEAEVDAFLYGSAP